MSRFSALFSSYSSLAKIRISFFSSLSAAACFILASGRFTLQCAMVTCSVFLLASGACALNHYQDRFTDSLMPRTAGRPIPSGRVRPLQALVFSLAMLFLGAVTIFSCGGSEALLLGFFAVLWYNGVYAFLKKKSAFAAIPGALTGAVSPAIGWVSGGGSFFSPAIGAICICFFIWQIPHSWLLLLEYGEEYELAGLRSITRIWSSDQIERIVFVWILCTAAICLIIPLFLVSMGGLGRIMILCPALWLAGSSGMLLYQGKSESARAFLFGKLNVCLFANIALLVFDRLLYV